MTRRFSLLCLAVVCHSAAATPPDQAELAGLGQLLFFDSNLSLNRTQACATCHDPQLAFTDPRRNASGRAVSLGDDGHSLGDRHTPAIGYVGLTPDLRIAPDGAVTGGFFYDGRAATLAQQAKAPIVNPIEMALPDSAVLAARIRENPAYPGFFIARFGPSVMTDDEALHDAVGISIAAFERSRMFAPFDSRYDRYLRGEYQLTEAEETGRLLFFADLLNCNGCHHLNADPTVETFTDYSYHNIGVPANLSARAVNDTPAGHTDQGLLDHPDVHDPAQRGKFKVPSLRNVAVTAPYMHNGVFAELATVLRFYNKFLIKDTINPETGAAWREPEVADNLSTELLTRGQPLSAMHMDAMLAFLNTLTDARYEGLLNETD